MDVAQGDTEADNVENLEENVSPQNSLAQRLSKKFSEEKKKQVESFK